MTSCKGCKVLSWHYMALTYRVLEYLLYNYTTKKSWFALDKEGYKIIEQDFCFPEILYEIMIK